MKDLEVVSQKIDSIIKDLGIVKYSYSLVTKEKREFNAEQGDFSLLRTLFDNSFVINVFDEGRKGTIVGNDLSDEALKKAVSDALLSAKSAPQDPAHDIAPKEEPRTFVSGCVEPEPDRFFFRLEELLNAVKAEYRKVKLMTLVADHVKKHVIFKNSNGTFFEKTSGEYSCMLEFSGNDGTNTTGLDACGVTVDNLDVPFIELGSFRTNLDRAQKQLNQIPFSGKFEGTVVFAPDIVGQLFYMIVSNYCSDSVILDGTSLWLDKIGQKVAADCLTVGINPSDPRIVNGESFTDGFLTEDVPFIVNGILKNHFISLYVANKTGRKVTKNTSYSIVMKEGCSTYEDIVKSIDRGLVVGGFSGGRPGTNGDFSGVAKNAFMIENGKISGAVSETMINGNLGALLENIVAISKETVIDGSSVLPYMACKGIVVSGK